MVRFNVCVKYLMCGENFDEMLFIFEIMLLVLFVVMVIGWDFLRFYFLIVFVKILVKFLVVWEEFNCLVCKVWFWILKLLLI